MNSRARNARPVTTVSIIGAGRMGTALGLALASRGYSIEAIVGHEIQSAKRAAHIVWQRIRKSQGRAGKPTESRGPVVLDSNNLTLLPATDLILITTPDEAISETATILSSTLKRLRRGRTALHTSGALSSNALVELRALNFATGSMHPLVSVSDGSEGAEKLAGAYYCLEGDARALAVARSLVHNLGGRHFSIQPRYKALYHAAAVMASGNLVALVDIASAMLIACGLKSEQAREILAPLLRSTIDNLATRDPSQALTGAFARADAITVRRHLTALRELSDPDALAAYTLLGKRSLKLARANGVSPRALKGISDIIDALLASNP